MVKLKENWLFIDSVDWAKIITSTSSMRLEAALRRIAHSDRNVGSLLPQATLHYINTHFHMCSRDQNSNNDHIPTMGLPFGGCCLQNIDCHRILRVITERTEWPAHVCRLFKALRSVQICFPLGWQNYAVNDDVIGIGKQWETQSSVCFVRV